MVAVLTEFTVKECLLFVGLAGVNLGCGVGGSIQASFYPREAEKRGVSATEYGMVFGIFELIAFIIYPIMGVYVGKLGVTIFISCGMVASSFGIVTFGFLGFVSDHWWFIGLSYAVRIVEALGTAAVITASVSIVVVVYTKSYATVLAMVDSLEALGYIIGPTIGGYFYEIGGFYCPFLVMGIFVLLSGLLIVSTLPEKKENKTEKTHASLKSVLKIVPVSLDAFSMVIEALTMGWLTATLEPHLRKFLLSPTTIGTLFIIGGFVYTVCSPLVGILCDKKLNTKLMIIGGSVLTIISFALIGPFPFTPFELSLPMVYTGLVTYGVGMSLIFVPAFVDAANSAIKYGLPDDINTYALVSGMYGSAVALGAFIGPLMSGVLYDAVGFRHGTLFVLTAHVILCAAMIWFVCVEKNYRPSKIDVFTTSANPQIST